MEEKERKSLIVPHSAAPLSFVLHCRSTDMNLTATKGAARDGQVGGELCNFYAENGTREDGLLWTEEVNPKAESGCRND